MLYWLQGTPSKDFAQFRYNITTNTKAINSNNNNDNNSDNSNIKNAAAAFLNTSLHFIR